ncbi:UDP-glucuronosyl/UDP-glucosyltransferase protein [Dioscorea alata]|uniref:UDP-glucuronosyl/UDP-glucosyltransferase protein n=1 Tax=Dioscorea alata TaxID=55571 RepID=A0ACB7UHF4_DIOAL|nr:UDP-glucuronosyl/UDP-glucosyltransferase protein [Dioscorea alata]
MVSAKSVPHVAFLAFPFGTHASPLFSLARALAADAPSTAFSFFNSARSNSSLLQSLPSGLPPNLRTFDVPDNVPEGTWLPPVEVRLFLEVTPGNFLETMAAAEGEFGRVTCVVGDAFLWFAGDVAAERGASWVALWTGGPCSLAAHLYTDLLRDTFGVEDQVVYISFGTVIMPSPQELTEMAAGLEASGVPFLWSLKDMARKHLPEGFLDRVAGRGLVVPWAPQTQVLGHLAVGAFLTHCGWNSVLESISCGVPLICRPFFGDQCLNAKTVSCVWEIGVAFESRTMEKEDMVRVLNVVLKTEEGKKMSEKADKLKTTALQATKPGGNSIKNFDTLVKMIVGNHGS